MILVSKSIYVYVAHRKILKPRNHTKMCQSYPTQPKWPIIASVCIPPYAKRDAILYDVIGNMDSK